MVKIFIGNLSTGESVAAITARDLKPLFDTYGTVTECVVNENRDYGFVHMPDKKEAYRAIRDLNGCQVVGQRINVELSTAEKSSGIGKKSSKSSNEQMLGTSATSFQDVSIASFGDCYNYLFNECLKKEKCPYIHRTLPKNICKKFLFGKCSRPQRCSREHLDTCSISEPSHRDKAKLGAQTGSGLETGARRKKTVSGVVKQQRTVRMSAFQCLDCGVTATSLSMLETHLNTLEHFEKVNQTKFEGKELKGVEDSEDVMCEVCGVRVTQGKWETHTQEELHVALTTEQEDWVTVGERSSSLPSSQYEKEKESSDIHVTNIPPDMTMNTFRKICLQFGQVTKLKMLSMDRSKGQHAYVRYISDQVGDVAALKLKKLQKCHFANQSDKLLDSSEKLETKVLDLETKIFTQRKFGCNLCGAVCNSMREVLEHKKSHGFGCDECDVLCNSEKQLRQHQRSHLKTEDEENNYIGGDDSFKESLLEEQEIFTKDDHSECIKFVSADTSHQQHFYKMALSRVEQEKMLMICQNKMLICKQSGAGVDRILQLLEEELDIQRKLRDLELEEHNSRLQSCYHSSGNSSDKEEHILNRVPYFAEAALSEDITAFDYHSSIKSTYNPDEVFNSDDSQDDDGEQFLQSQILSAHESRQCAVLDQQVRLTAMLGHCVDGPAVANLSFR